MSEINMNATCWTDSGLTFEEILAVNRVAREFPDGAYAAFVRLMNEGQHRYWAAQRAA